MLLRITASVVVVAFVCDRVCQADISCVSSPGSQGFIQYQCRGTHPFRHYALLLHLAISFGTDGVHYLIHHKILGLDTERLFTNPRFALTRFEFSYLGACYLGSPTGLGLVTPTTCRHPSKIRPTLYVPKLIRVTPDEFLKSGTPMV